MDRDRTNDAQGSEPWALLASQSGRKTKDLRTAYPT